MVGRTFTGPVCHFVKPLRARNFAVGSGGEPLGAVGIVDKTALVMQASDVTPLAQAQAAGPIYIGRFIRALFPCGQPHCPAVRARSRRQNPSGSGYI